jgi:hypothetical protein
LAGKTRKIKTSHGKGNEISPLGFAQDRENSISALACSHEPRIVVSENPTFQAVRVYFRIALAARDD